MLIKHHDLALELPTWMRAHEHMLLNNPPIVLQICSGAAHRRRGSNTILSSPIDRLFVTKTMIADSAPFATPPSQIPPSPREAGIAKVSRGPSRGLRMGG